MAEQTDAAFDDIDYPLQLTIDDDELHRLGIDPSQVQMERDWGKSQAQCVCTLSGGPLCAYSC